MNEVALQACLKKIITLDQACVPPQIEVQLHAPLEHRSDTPGIDIARRWMGAPLDEALHIERHLGSAPAAIKRPLRLIEMTVGDEPLPFARRPGTEIGLAKIALVRGDGLIYFDYQWGSLCDGAGLWKYDKVSDNIVWISTLSMG